MNIQLTDDAIEWFETEMDVEAGEAVQFYARYGGASPLHEGFSLGIQKSEPEKIAAQTVINDVTYYIDEHDEWFFQDHNLLVSLNPDLNELHFDYEK